MNHILGGYIATGVNNPKRYPKKPRLHKDNDKLPQPLNDRKEQVRRAKEAVYGTNN